MIQPQLNTNAYIWKTKENKTISEKIGHFCIIFLQLFLMPDTRSDSNLEGAARINKTEKYF